MPEVYADRGQMDGATIRIRADSLIVLSDQISKLSEKIVEALVGPRPREAPDGPGPGPANTSLEANLNYAIDRLETARVEFNEVAQLLGLSREDYSLPNTKL
jgi:hypothetical protein